MDRDIRQELLDAIAVFQPTAGQLAVLDEREQRKYQDRCTAWRQRWNAAIATILACESTNRSYQIETLGYLVWLLHKRPMRRPDRIETPTLRSLFV